MMLMEDKNLMMTQDRIKQTLQTADCLYNAFEVETALSQMASQMNIILANSCPIFLCMVMGAIVPLGNLLPKLNFPLELDYLHATRYADRVTGGSVEWLAEPKKNLKDRVIVLFDDILDGGITIKAAMEHVRSKQPEKIYSAVLIDKEEARLKEGLQQADFVGLKAPNRYLFGYGMDYKGYWRNAPGIYALAE